MLCSFLEIDHSVMCSVNSKPRINIVLFSLFINKFYWVKNFKWQIESKSNQKEVLFSEYIYKFRQCEVWIKKKTLCNIILETDLLLEIGFNYNIEWESEESEWVNESRSVVSDSFQPHGLYSPWNSPSQNTGVGSLSLPSPGDLPKSGI